LAAIGYPAHLINRQLSGLLGRFGLGRVPGALLVGLALAALTSTTVSSTLQAYDARPEAQPASIGEVVDGRVASGVWIEFDGVLIDGPHLATVEVFGGGESTLVDRIYYLVADPESSDRALVLRARSPIVALEAADGPIRLDGTISEDAFNMRSLLAEWDPLADQPDVELSETRLLAYAFETPFLEPSWIGSIILGLLAAIVLSGAAVRQPILRRSPSAAGARGQMPIDVAIHGQLGTPRGPVRLHGTPAQLAWMNVEEVARTRWRYWGAALGDMRGDVETAVRAHGDAGERLVLHGPTGSVIWPIERPGELVVEAGDAFLGLRRSAALRVRGDGADATLTFADRATRDAALAELGSADAAA